MNSKHLFLLTLISALTVSACGGGGEETRENTVESTVKTTENIKKEPQSALERGAVVYKKCRVCHTLKDGEKHLVGPNLYNTMGKIAGQKDGFSYSKALLAANVTWTDENLDAYFEKPMKFIPGNRMSFVGIRKAEDRAALIEYLRQETTPAQ